MSGLSHTLMRAMERVRREIEENNSNEPDTSALRFFTEAIKPIAVQKGFGDDFRNQTLYEVYPPAHGGIQFGFKKNGADSNPVGDVEYIVRRDGTVSRGRFLGNGHWVANNL